MPHLARLNRFAVFFLAALAASGCGGDHVTTETDDAFGPVGTAVWLEFDVDDDAPGALTRGEKNYVLVLTDAENACELITDAVDDCADALRDHDDLSPDEQCTEGDALLEDLGDVFDGIYGSDHRMLTAFFYDDGDLYDAPLLGAQTVGADLSDSGAALRIDFMQDNPLEALAESWDNASCGTEDEASALASSLSVYVAQSGTVEIDRIDSDGVAGRIDAVLNDADGGNAGQVSAAFDAPRCEINVRNSEDAQCAAFALPPLAFSGYGGTGTPGPDNLSACRAYVAAANAAYAACDRNIVVDENQTCPASINNGADCTPYYTELRDGVSCTDGEVVFTPADSTCDG